MFAATVTVNLDHDPDDLDRADRHALQYLAQVPDARLGVIVGKRYLLANDFWEQVLAVVDDLAAKARPTDDQHPEARER